MIAAKHSMMSHGVPYDYRVMYFQRTDPSSGTGYFLLPPLRDINTAIVGNEDDAGSELISVDFLYSVTLGFAPGSMLTGDRQLFGDAGVYCLYIYGGRWRPGGVNVWPQGPTAEQFPLSSGVSVRMDVDREGYSLFSSDGRGYSLGYSHGNCNPTLSTPVLISGSLRPGSNVALGGRYFGSSIRNEHSVWGFSANYICVIKDDEPYIYDTVSGEFYPKIGGGIGIGPECKVDFDPLTFIET